MLVLLVLLPTAAPLIPVGWWPIRIWDFPRLQILVVAAMLLLFTLVLAHYRHWRSDSRVLLGALIAVILWQGWHIAPYTPLWPKAVPTAQHSDFSLLVCNLDIRNTQHDQIAAMLREEDPDILILVELDQTWHDRLQTIADAYPHMTETVLPDGLGLGVWSKLPLSDTEIRHIVSERRPSIFTTVTLDTHEIRLVAIHPTPPAMVIEGKDGRYDSSIRDAELMLLAAHIAEQPHTNWIVAGDYNDVAWSRATALFSNISGLADPRIGRGLINTYHARYQLMRYPLDHVFVSEDFAVESFNRVAAPGSDHFAVRVALQFRPQPDTDDPVEKDEAEAASEMVRDGVEQAHEHNEEADDSNPGTPPQP